MTTRIDDTPTRVPVLMYHRVGAAANAWGEKYCVAPGRFRAQMQALARHGMRPCGVDEFVAWLLHGAPLARGSVLLTFDDGFRDVFDHAFPVLRDLGWPCTVFLVSGQVGGTDAWTARSNPAGRAHALLGRGEIATMQRSGIAFQSHTRNHLDLTTLDDEALAAELAGSKRDLEALLGQPVRYLAYPFGKVDERVAAAALAAGYVAAFSVQPGFNRVGQDPLRIRRLDVYGTDTPAQLLRKLRLGTNDGSVRAMVGYYVRRARGRAGRLQRA